MPTVKPLQWLSWWDARLRMPAIWRPWADLHHQANEAMANALRRGRVPCRGPDGVDTRGRRVRLVDILPTLKEILLTSETAAVKYTWRVTTRYAPFRPSGLHIVETPPDTVEATAQFPAPELDWDAFCDELIRFGLPAGVQPDRARSPQRRGARRKRPKQMRAIDRQPQRGPKPGATGFGASDNALFSEIERLRTTGEARSTTAATRILANDGKIRGAGTLESLAIRLARRYGQWKAASTSKG